MTLTPRQQAALNFIRAYIARYGYPPTRFDIAYQMGFKSLNSAQLIVKALAKKGAIELMPHISRGIRVTQ